MSQSGWSYPPGSILFKLYLVPIEEHLFFILQPILVILLHCLITHPQLVPFRIPPRRDSVRLKTRIASATVREDANGAAHLKAATVEVRKEDVVQTLPRRRGAALLWGLPWLAGAFLVNEAHQLVNTSEWTNAMPEPLRQVIAAVQVGRHGFYLGWILVWISPVIAFLTYLGARLRSADYKALVISTAWLHMVDT